MILASIVGIIIWMYILSVCRRARLDFLFYVVGSVGFFLFAIILVRPLITWPLSWLVATVTGEIGEALNMFQSYAQYGMLFIPKDTAAVSLYIDFECSGVIEILAFMALLWFFKIYNIYEKILVSIAGVLWIFWSNVIRLLSICITVYFFGNDSFYFAHSILGRLIFYALTIMLYFYVFTKPQVVRQNIGNFGYNREKEEEDK